MRKTSHGSHASDPMYHPMKMAIKTLKVSTKQIWMLRAIQGKPYIIILLYMYIHDIT